MSDKTEKATPYKLQKAKEKGQVNKSNELITSFFLILMIIASAALWPSLGQLKALLTQLLSLATRFSLSTDALIKLQHLILTSLLNLWLPFALAAVLSLILATLSQTGFIWTMVPLKPDLKRLNPIQGLKRLFSAKMLVDTGKSSLKLVLAFSLIIISLHHNLATLLKFMVLSPVEHPVLIRSLLFKTLLQLLALLFALALVDKLYVGWKYKKDNRMTKQEVKDEYRQREGDPKIKAKIRQLQQQMRQKNAALEQVKTADVVVTNPTRLAIALKYEPGSMPAPKVVCKAQGEFAAQVRALAQRHKVPLIENKAFARALFATIDLNQWISQEHFPTAALIFREIYRQRELA
ncbi:Flagellar biosynthetic protein FlhB [Legionella massiliensis]|uniref:Flagellar biosynthetic protein FlhB n=1 Tax=Legionella massiliensis TaxID=1034943 RepID=A0A078KRL9_9GAMM|nr:EscU/YscU/HrcU family type III secretion system export apparatus switch protein [Legionella massiliensis]CDZ77070.1 Flagellar biosynthetic protein FlhB [Legionella massiliensis]CEE12808.1 Flagellar biosynthetic protein FlhB [Legionella massiliensis]